MMADNDSQERVRRRAYELWEAEGRRHGRDLAHWLQAESELGSQGKARSASAGRGRRKTASVEAAKPAAAPRAASRRKPKSGPSA